MRISADVRAYATEHGLSTTEALEAGMREKSAEFTAAGGQVYLPMPDSRHEDISGLSGPQ
jgi:phosphomethylpyrimidine synthase